MDAKLDSPALSAFPPSAASVPVPIPYPDQSISKGALSSLWHNPITAAANDAYQAFSERRAALGLSNPGTVEGISREVTRDVFLNNSMFTGFRADFTKAFSAAPLFQTAHNFTMGSGGMPPYSFAALYGSPKVFFQGNIDNEFQLSARANYRLSSGLVAKSNISLAPGGTQSMVQLEADYVGADFTANIKAMNPSILSGVAEGIFVGSYMQSLTPRLALGMETMYQRVGADQGPEVVSSYAARYKGDDWIAAGQLLAQGSVQATYWRRLAERVEAGLEVNLSLLGLSGGGGMMGMARNEGVATMGAKYDFRTSVFRGQIDTTGKVSAVLEKRIAQPVQITFAGEMDHAKNSAKIGMAISIEGMGSEEVMEQQERMMSAAEQQQPPPF
ncbi:hypothetical protein FH972_024674 [Carpinus fangiana]|uniref:Uncharacterized protein n=1 Tax=Carpinus fangiana TaxID=176857 RepID=A0A5N6KZ72_9ROSI|nr:hypothetical protein FH972_024674 [Carpinus fangiana]